MEAKSASEGDGVSLRAVSHLAKNLSGSSLSRAAKFSQEVSRTKFCPGGLHKLSHLSVKSVYLLVP